MKACVVATEHGFEPGARTAWHTHPLGQTLIVASGCSRMQREGGPIDEIRPGDVVWFSSGEKHWHGTAPSTAMSHIAVQEKLDGKVADWMEHVTTSNTGHRLIYASAFLAHFLFTRNRIHYRRHART